MKRAALLAAKRASILIAAALFCGVRAPAAADSLVDLTLEGRPVDRHVGIAVLHHGLVFADAIDLTKCFDGFITLMRGGVATITIGPNTGTFTPGVRRALVNAAVVPLPGAPFRRNGDLFVPLEAFITSVAAANVRFNSSRRHADIRVNVRARR